MSIERNLPENRQRFLDSQVLHWEEVLRRIGSARDMLKLAQAEFSNSPQATDQFVVGWFEALRCNLEYQVINARQMAETAAKFADENNERTQGK